MSTIMDLELAQENVPTPVRWDRSGLRNRLRGAMLEEQDPEGQRQQLQQLQQLARERLAKEERPPGRPRRR